MVTRLTDYTKQFWSLLSTDDMDTLGSHNGDEAILIDRNERLVFDEENQTWRQIPMSGGGGGGGGGSIPGVSLIQQITLTENTRAVQLDVPSGYDWVYIFVNGAFVEENWVYTDINGSVIAPYSAKISTIRLGWSFAITVDGEKLYYYVPNASVGSRMTCGSTTLPFNTVRVRGYSADFVAGTKLLMFGGKYEDL